MKVSLIAITIFIFVCWFMQYFVNKEYHKEQMLKLESIELKLEQRMHIDSLYHHHLSQCAFELREPLAYENLH